MFKVDGSLAWHGLFFVYTDPGVVYNRKKLRYRSITHLSKQSKKVEASIPSSRFSVPASCPAFTPTRDLV